MKFASLFAWIKIILILFSITCHKINGDCECSLNACDGCSVDINGLYCIDDLICEVFNYNVVLLNILLN